MTKLPAKALLDGTKNPETTTGEFRLAMGNIRQFLFELFGDESSDKETARQTLGIDITVLNDGIASKADKQTVEAALDEKADKNDLSLVATTGDYNHLVNKPEKSDTLEGYGIIADNIPTAGSTRPVTSEGIKNYVDHKAATIPHGMQVFTQSGIFVVPEGVTQVLIELCGGGGGGGMYKKWGGSGGTTSFGSLLTATGGGGGGHGNGGSAGSPFGEAGSGGSLPEGEYFFGPPGRMLGYYGRGGNSAYGSVVGSGGSGGWQKAYVNVSPGETIAVTIGGGGAGNGGGNGIAGICTVEW